MKTLNRLHIGRKLVSVHCVEFSICKFEQKNIKCWFNVEMWFCVWSLMNWDDLQSLWPWNTLMVTADVFDSWQVFVLNDLVQNLGIIVAQILEKKYIRDCILIKLWFNLKIIFMDYGFFACKMFTFFKDNLVILRSNYYRLHA